MHQRIEKSAFRAGEYVGYMDGAWKVRKREDGQWRAVKADGSDSFGASTLEGIGKGLDQRATRVTGKALFST